MTHMARHLRPYSGLLKTTTLLTLHPFSCPDYIRILGHAIRSGVQDQKRQKPVSPELEAVFQPLPRHIGIQMDSRQLYSGAKCSVNPRGKGVKSKRFRPLFGEAEVEILPPNLGDV